MDSRTFSVQQIYQDRRQYRVPFYQRRRSRARFASGQVLHESQ